MHPPALNALRYSDSRPPFATPFFMEVNHYRCVLFAPAPEHIWFNGHTFFISQQLGSVDPQHHRSASPVPVDRLLHCLAVARGPMFRLQRLCRHGSAYLARTPDFRRCGCVAVWLCGVAVWFGESLSRPASPPALGPYVRPSDQMGCCVSF